MFFDSHDRCALATDIHGISRILQAQDMSNNNEGLGKEASVLSKVERRWGIDSNVFDTTVSMKAAG